MNCSPFSCPIFLGHSEARGRCSQGERMLYGRDLCRSGGTGKAEAAKCVLCIPDTGPRAQELARSRAQENARQKKDRLPKSVRIARRSTVAETDRVERCQGALYGRRLREHSGESKQC